MFLKRHSQDPESIRLEEESKRVKNWKRWGPYLSERQWGTVREDYSVDGSCWSYFPFEMSHSRAYRWGEDGLFGISDRQCRLCFSMAFWNGKDPYLKERLFGLTGPQGIHGEDVKELYYYLDNTPTHSYMRALYKYPQQRFPYEKLIEQNIRCSKNDSEYELLDTGIFDANQYFDIEVEYAKRNPAHYAIRLNISNRSDEPATLLALPTLWFRNSWAWGRVGEAYSSKPTIKQRSAEQLITQHQSLEPYVLEIAKNSSGVPLFTENETNIKKLFNSPMEHPYVKDSFSRYFIENDQRAVNPKLEGTKATFPCQLSFAPKETKHLRLRLFQADSASEIPKSVDSDVEEIIEERHHEADRFYNSRLSKELSRAECEVSRQAYAGLLWNKQFYYFSVKEWHEGDPSQPAVPANRPKIRNSEWGHLYNRDIISMPDKWEYPWYAAWDLAFHTIPLATVDPTFAKEQLLLLLREWYMHPNGQLPAYEFAFSDVNPPVHAWACWRVYKISGPRGERDREFLARCFHKLLINFTWWVNRKDLEGNNLFAGGFLGLDNIGVFDRGQPLPTGGTLEQADGTAWMAFYCLTMLTMALELSSEDPSYGDIASKFFEHFVSISDAINHFGGTGLWDEQDGFYYDQIRNNQNSTPLRLRSLVGIIPLLAVELLNPAVTDKLEGFSRRTRWFVKNRKDLMRTISYLDETPGDGRHLKLLAIPTRERLGRMLKYILDENEFLSEFGVRSLSKHYQSNPYIFRHGNNEYRVDYTPGESTTAMFGGNSNWRGPVWFPINYLMIEALERYHHFYGDTFKVECPTGSGNLMNLAQVATELARRLSSIFVPNSTGLRAAHGSQGADARYTQDPNFKNLILFHEFFHGDTGKGLGAAHQTGWTALVARCIEKLARERGEATGYQGIGDTAIIG